MSIKGDMAMNWKKQREYYKNNEIKPISSLLSWLSKKC